MFWRTLSSAGRVFLIVASVSLLAAAVLLLLDLDETGVSRHRAYQAGIALALSVFATALVGFTLDYSHERERRTQATNAIRVFGLDRVLGQGPLGGKVAIVLPSFSGAESILNERSHWDEVPEPPKNFVHGDDDISRDFFFGKRDVFLASQVANAIARAGNPTHIYVEDRHLWESLRVDTRAKHGSVIVEQDSERHAIDSVVVVGLWSNILTTALADCGIVNEFRMAGDPTVHQTRIVRFRRSDGLNVIDLQAQREDDITASNPAIPLSVRLRDVHVSIVGGATSLSTLRLAEYLSRDQNWSKIAQVKDDAGSLIDSPSGFWFAFQCPNSADFRDRTQIVSSGRISDNSDRLFRDILTYETESKE